MKSDHIKRFAAHDFLEVIFTLQTSRTNNKQEGPKVKSDHMKRFAAHDFL